PILADSTVDIQLTTALRLFQMNHPTVLYVGSLPVDADIDLAVHRICDTVNQHAFLATNPKFCRWDRGPESRLQPTRTSRWRDTLRDRETPAGPSERPSRPANLRSSCLQGGRIPSRRANSWPRCQPLRFSYSFGSPS